MPLQTTFSVKRFIWMSKNRMFTDKDQTFSMDITTEGPRRKLHIARYSNVAFFCLKITISAQLVQLPGCPFCTEHEPYTLRDSAIPPCSCAQACSTWDTALMDHVHLSESNQMEDCNLWPAVRQACTVI